MDPDLTPVVPSTSELGGPHVPLESLETLDRYKLVARIGQGGMAEVYLAAWEVAPHEHRPLVVKRLHGHLSDDPLLLQMFFDEARLVCQLTHPNIVETYEAGMIDGQCCIAMEHLQGQPFHRVLRRTYSEGALPVELGMWIAIRVLDALHFAHEARDASGAALGIVHRDISPHNVFITNDGRVKVLDFGIAKAKTRDANTALGAIKGKIGYIAPEQVSGGQVDRRADVWAVGVMLWEALTGAHLFKSETEAGTLHCTLHGQIPPANSRRPSVRPELDAVLARALSRTPEKRFATALAMKQSLERCLGERAAPSERALAQLMQRVFPIEIAEQERMVSVMMARSDSAPPSARESSGGPLVNSASRAVVSAQPLLVERPRSVASQRRMRRGLVVAVPLLAAGLAFGYLVTAPAPRWLGVLSPALASLGASPLTRGNEHAVAVSASLFEARATVSSPERPAPKLADELLRPAPTLAELDESNAGETEASPEPAAMAKAVAIAARPAERTEPLPRVAPRHAVQPSKNVAGPGAARTPGVEPAPDIARPGFGFLTIDSKPWAWVSVNGKALGQTPLVGARLPAGAQVVVLRNPELGLETQYAVTIEVGKTIVRRIGLE